MSLATDRVRKHTAAAVLRRIDHQTEASLQRCAEAPQHIDARLAELDREWDTDRAIETEAATMGLIGLALGTFIRRELLAIPLMVGSAVFLHATTGWYPLLPLFRRLGLRSAREIERERYALKALRGDFADMSDPAAERNRATAPASGAAEAAHAAAPQLVGTAAAPSRGETR